MNGTGMTPSPYDVGVGGSMKAFLLLIMVIAGFIFFASTAFANVDLTPDTAAAVAIPATGAGASETEYEVVTIKNDTVLEPTTVTGVPVYTVPVTGTCTNPYTVRQGDMLSSIAVLCNTTVADIRLANPEIVNANLIYAGQQIRIPGTNTASVPVTSGAEPTQPVVVQQAQVVSNALGAPGISMAMIAPGTGVQVTGINFPANIPVYIAIGPQATGYTITASGMTDASGSVTSTVIIPTPSIANEPWVVVITTTDSPAIQAASAPFLIQP